MAHRKRRRIQRACVLPGLLFVNFSLVMLLAQSTAQVTGTIKDQTGAVLPCVEVTVTQSDTGFRRSAVTNETGSYLLPSLPVGPYRFEAALPGFRTYTQTGIILQVDSNPVINAVLQVGQVSALTWDLHERSGFGRISRSNSGERPLTWRIT